MSDARNFDARFVGMQPRFPGVLDRWRWLNEPVAAERMAAPDRDGCRPPSRSYSGILPRFTDFFSPTALGGRGSSHGVPRRAFLLVDTACSPTLGSSLAHVRVGGAAVALLIGYRPFLTGLVCWACGLILERHPRYREWGDQLRNTLLLGVAFGRSGAVWVSSERRRGHLGPVHVPVGP